MFFDTNIFWSKINSKKSKFQKLFCGDPHKIIKLSIEYLWNMQVQFDVFHNSAKNIFGFGFKPQVSVLGYMGNQVWNDSERFWSNKISLRMFAENITFLGSGTQNSHLFYFVNSVPTCTKLCCMGFPLGFPLAVVCLRF